MQEKPYHISALYLVDLKRFRALAAGDQVRGDDGGDKQVEGGRAGGYFPIHYGYIVMGRIDVR